MPSQQTLKNGSILMGMELETMLTLMMIMMDIRMLRKMRRTPIHLTQTLIQLSLLSFRDKVGNRELEALNLHPKLIYGYLILRQMMVLNPARQLGFGSVRMFGYAIKMIMVLSIKIQPMGQTILFMSMSKTEAH